MSMAVVVGMQASMGDKGLNAQEDREGDADQQGAPWELIPLMLSVACREGWERSQISDMPMREKQGGPSLHAGPATRSYSLSGRALK